MKAPIEFVGPVCGAAVLNSRRPKPARVYALRCQETGRIKFGSSHDPERRHRELRHLSSTRIDLVTHCWGSPTAERSIHSALTASRVHGEWYEPTQPVLAMVDEIATGGWNLFRGGIPAIVEAAA
jgi:hypothetical protein